MGSVQKIVGQHDIFTDVGFESAMEKMRTVSEGELHFLASQESTGHPADLKKAYALAKAELARRNACDQRKLVRASGYWGFGGVVVGALLQGVISWLLKTWESGFICL